MTGPDRPPPMTPAPGTLRDWRRPAQETWRRGAAAVLALTFDLDAESGVLGRAPSAADDLSAMSHQAYGSQVGLPRVLALLTDTGTSATFFVPGDSARRWPRAVELILDAGQEIALHSDQHQALVGMSDEEQDQDLQANLQALHGFGVEPVGYRAPNWQLTATTLALLIANGLTYDSSLMDDDLPYVIDHPAGRMTELPVHWSLDDWEQYAFLPEPDIGRTIDTPAKVLELWTGELDAMRATGSLCVVCCHPFLSGRPSRLRTIERFIRFAHECGDVELRSCRDVAAAVIGS